MDPDNTSRVTMIWPTELKEQVRAMVGSRGLTDYVLEAVRMRLAQQEPDGRNLHVPVTGVEAVGDGTQSVHVAPIAPSSNGRPDCPNCHAPLIAGECWSCG